MCYINIRGIVEERKTVDPDKGTILSNYGIQIQNLESQNGLTACIPVDAKAKNRLRNLGLPVISLNDFSTNEEISISMQGAEAIKSGIFDISTIESIDAMPTVCHNPQLTYWHQLKHFFKHYKRDVDSPMQWGELELTFWIPPILHPNVKRLLITSPFLNKQQLRNIFPDQEMEVVQVEPTAWLPGNKLFQIRSSSKSQYEMLLFNSQTKKSDLSKIGERYLAGIWAEIKKDKTTKHAIITYNNIARELSSFAQLPNVIFVRNFKSILTKAIDMDAVQVLWLVGCPRWQRREMWQRAQMLFGNDEKPLTYDDEMRTDRYQDERIQGLYEQYVTGLLTQIIGRFGMNRKTGKTVVLLNNFQLPDITDRPETQLFDWADFEIADGLEKLEETIRIRESFEAERDKLTADTERAKVERVLGCSSRQANRVLNKLRGGNINRVSYREQILFLLSSGREKTTASLVAAIDSSPQAIGNELKRLLDAGEIVRIRRGVYALPQKQ